MSNVQTVSDGDMVTSGWSLVISSMSAANGFLDLLGRRRMDVGLRQIVLLDVGAAVLVGPVPHHRDLLEVAVRRRRRGGPFQGGAVPRVARRLGAPQQAVEE